MKPRFKSAPIKIAMVSDAIYPYNKGGKEKRIYEMSTRLASQGFDVHIYCMKWWKENTSQKVENGVLLHAISPLYPLYSGERRSIRQAVFFALSCLKLIKESFDVIDVDHMPHLVLFSVKLIALLKRKKLISTWNEVWGKAYWQQYLGKLGPIAYIIELISAQLPDEIIAVSMHTKEKLQNELGVKSPIFVIPNGIDSEYIAKIQPAKQTSHLIFAGRLLSNKNVDVLIHAVSIIKKQYPFIKALIIGEGPEKTKLQQLIHRLQLEKNISLLGFLEKHSEVYALMKASKVFVFPSMREGFGIAALEANACGIPIITTDYKDNATKYLINQGKNGYVVSATAEEIASSAVSLLKRKKLSNMADYTTSYHWKTLANEVRKVYTK